MRKAGAYWRAADASDTASLILPDLLGINFSPKGGVAQAIHKTAEGRRWMSVIKLDSAQRPTHIHEVNAPDAARISPDGRWIAYVAEEGGQNEVFVRPMSASGGYVKISAGGGSEPVWNPRGGELFYRAGTQPVAVTLALEPRPRVLKRDSLSFKLPESGAGGAPAATYDVSPDGRRFLVAKPIGGNAQAIVVTGWLDSVRKVLKAPH
jgi:hypothetical protein